jgi:hypothetical protein
MTEDMQYYIPPEEGWKKHFEGLVPIIILILIAIVLVGKTTNFFCTVPVLSAIFCGSGQINVGLIGDYTENAQTNIKANIFKLFIDQEGLKSNIHVKAVPDYILEYPKENALKQFDVVVVAGIQNLSFNARDALGYYLAGGGKVIIIGDSGIRDSSDPAVIGWSEAAFGDYAPVRLAAVGPAIPRVTINSPQLNYFSEEHPILSLYAEAYKIDFTNFTYPSCNSQIDALQVAPKSGTEMLAVLASADGRQSVLGIAEKKSGFNGANVIYFNYDPGCTYNAVLTTLRYLSGKR